MTGRQAGAPWLRVAPGVDAMKAHGPETPQHGHRHEGPADDGYVAGEEQHAQGEEEEHHADPASSRVPAHEGLGAHVSHVEGGEGEAQEESDGVDDEYDEPEGNAKDGDHAEDGEDGNGRDEEEPQAEALEGVHADGARGK